MLSNELDAAVSESMVWCSAISEINRRSLFHGRALSAIVWGSDAMYYSLTAEALLDVRADKNEEFYYVCEHCKAEFSRESELLAHAHTHTPEGISHHRVTTDEFSDDYSLPASDI